ncbi:hypothetical protein N7462_011308 [Penicillium macrosclerotiorum]|uniref:uncharacterized protein n=1 Tax=Penicillium macrosclerotiorum TaxID=303699 RepID=UPI00254980F1|nr:uncharacterized protein N7462_011308 [Penicillium macrosclerotiorum]KAJ5666899.1 hypothetical protein N7462_011308 [Penicillium macrosclerotiorum]
MAEPEDHIAVDPESLSIGDNSNPEELQSETTSLASSIARGRLENGRRYQAMKDDYWGPSDEQQFEAFEIGHILHLVLDNDEPNPLFRSPIGDSPTHILDIGTGKGSWAIDVADLYPSAIVRGVDLFPPPATWMPPNCILEVDDVVSEWTWKEPFDLIHMRLMVGALTPEGWAKLYKQAYDALKPGGWIEQVELDVRLFSDDNSLSEDSLLGKWGDMFIACSERAGRSLRTQETMRKAIEEAGFVDTNEKFFKVPLGAWAKDQTLKEVGRIQYAHWNTALEGWAMWLLTKYGAPEPWTKEEVDEYLVRVRQEMKNPRLHAYEPYRRVWARKPTEEELKAKETSKS